MGFNSTAATIVLTARLTPMGRQKLLTSDKNLITQFSLGDGDANYFADTALGTGEIPVVGGEIGTFTATTTNSSPRDIEFRSNVFKTSGVVFSPIEPGSMDVTISDSRLGQTTVSAASLTQLLLNRNDLSTPGTATTTTSQFTNYFSSLALPITETEKHIFSGVPTTSGGYSNSGIANLNKDNVWLISIPQDQYGETLDGKEFRLTVSSSSEFNLYGTFQSTLTRPDVADKQVKESSLASQPFGNNMVFLFSDEVRTPNSGATTSWATGFGQLKPFSVGKKERFNLVANAGLNKIEDTVVGIAQLDRGLIAITDEAIVSGAVASFSAVTGSTEVTFNSVSTDVLQSVLIVLNRGEFATSNNSTFADGDVVRISEIGLHDNAGNLIAVAKPSQHIEKRLNDFLSIEININV